MLKKETSRCLECSNRCKYRCVCNKELFRQERGSSLPAARGSRVQVTWLKASRSKHQSSNAVTPYSLDPSPCHYVIFGPLKKARSCKWSTSDDEVKQYVRNRLITQTQEFYETVIHRLCRSVTSASTASANTSDIEVLLSVPRPPARFFLNAPHMSNRVVLSYGICCFYVCLFVFRHHLKTAGRILTKLVIRKTTVPGICYRL